MMNVRWVLGGAALVGLVGLSATALVLQARLDSAQLALSHERGMVLELRTRLSESETALRGVEGRLDDLNASVSRMGRFQAMLSTDLNLRLDQIRNITLQPGDSHEAISCLDVRAPAELNRSVR